MVASLKVSRNNKLIINIKHMEKVEKEIEEVSLEEKKRGGGGRWMFLLLVIIIIVVALGFLNMLPGTGTMVASSDYQAVFLSNGQVYFGKAHNPNNQYVSLTDIYYLQVTQQLQPAPNQPAAQNISLVKLGAELHGPQDEMRINRDHVLFIEDLKPSSEVSKAIQNYKAQQATPKP